MCDEDTEEPSGGWYSGHASAEDLEKCLVGKHELMLQIKDTRIEEIHGLLRKGYGQNHNPFDYVPDQDQCFHALLYSVRCVVLNLQRELAQLVVEVCGNCILLQRASSSTYIHTVYTGMYIVPVLVDKMKFQPVTKLDYRTGK
eukprot:COSAG02_NODE_3107_length_7352_cov_61.084930_5_plen_143_part_00